MGGFAGTMQHRRLKELLFSGEVSVSAAWRTVEPGLAHIAVSLLREPEWKDLGIVRLRMYVRAPRLKRCMH